MTYRGGDRLSHEELEKVRTAFARFDMNNDGRISSRELGKVLRGMGHNPREREIRDMMDKMDTDGSGYIEFSEFCRHMKDQMRGRGSDDRELREAFRVFDRDNSGYISSSELRRILSEIGEPMSRDEVEEVMREADFDRNGKLDVEEFIQLMKNG